MENNSIYNPELNIGNLCPNVVAYYFKEWEDFDMTPGHAHNQVEIMYIISGACVIQAAGSKFEMKKGAFILIDANVHHNLIVNGANRCKMLNIEFRFTRDLQKCPVFKNVIESSESYRKFAEYKYPYVVFNDLEGIYPIFRNLIMELDGHEADRDTIVQLQLCYILMKAFRLTDSYGDGNSISDKYVFSAIKYMHENYSADIKVEDIAKAVSLHPVYLQRVFKQSRNVTLMQYLRELRIEKAKMLIRNTDIPIIDISGYVGINSRQYFNYVFKNRTGRTPVEYRKKAYPVKLSGAPPDDTNLYTE